MAISRKEKESIVHELKEKLVRAKILLFTDFRGLAVKDISVFRRELRKNRIDFQVIKKTLLKRALEESGGSFDPKSLEGQVALVMGYGDEVEPPRITYGFSKQNTNLKIMGGLMGRREMSVEEVLSLAKLPSRDELLAKLVFLVASPMTQFVSVLQGSSRNFVSVLSQIQKIK